MNLSGLFVCLVGAALLARGLYLIYPPLAWLWGGVLVLWLGLQLLTRKS